MSSTGSLALLLHAHLPYVRHPEYPVFLEERWLFEAITETYLPLLGILEGWRGDAVSARITVSISPTLLAMLEDRLLQERYDEHLGRLLLLAEREIERNRGRSPFDSLAQAYFELFTAARRDFHRYQGRLALPFRHLHERRVIELITTAATHGILPLLMPQPRTVEAQLRTGIDYFVEVFGFRPRGLWLPECAYAPELDPVLRYHGVRYFVLESHGLDHASITPMGGVHAPVFTPEGVAAFGRDQGSTREVWSAQHGFPGDASYREFYRDIGFDLDPAYIEQAMGLGVRAMTGIKYHRITGPTHDKQPYDPAAATARADRHATDFLERRLAHVRQLRGVTETTPIIVAPFDAELFGHWWFEGPQWLDSFVRKAAAVQNELSLDSLGDYLDLHPVHQVGQPSASTWGHAGYFETWLSPRTDWIYDHLVDCADRMERLAARWGATPVRPDVERALRQAVRELLLAQSSDWPFIISSNTSAGYAESRVRDHVARFHWLAQAIESGEAIDAEKLGALELLDNPFPNVDWRIFGNGAPAAS